MLLIITTNNLIIGFLKKKKMCDIKLVRNVVNVDSKTALILQKNIQLKLLFSTKNTKIYNENYASI